MTLSVTLGGQKLSPRSVQGASAWSESYANQASVLAMLLIMNNLPGPRWPMVTMLGVGIGPAAIRATLWHHIFLRRDANTMRNKQKGFSLIELLIVVAIILIIAAIAIPNLIRSRMAANEASAVAGLRTFNTSEVVYSTTYGGFSANLVNLGPGGTTCSSTTVPTATGSCLVDQVLATDPSTKSGYVTTYAPGTAITGATAGQVANYTLSAVPQAIGSTGQRGFFTDQSLVIRGDTSGKATVASAPI